MRSPFRVIHRGDIKFEKTLNALNTIAGIIGVGSAVVGFASGGSAKGILEKYGEIGVQALRAATPIDSGVTAASWSYEVESTGNGYTLSWYNSHMNQGVNIAILIQYGHGTGWGGYVPGTDYINPALRPIFDQIGNDIWREVTAV